MLEPVLIGLISAAIGAAIGFTAHAFTERRIRAVLEPPALALGLVVQPARFLEFNGGLSGSLEGLPVEVTMKQKKGKVLTRVAVKGADPAVTLRRETLAVKLGLTAERWLAPATETLWERAGDILIGEEGFDSRIDMRGPIPFCTSVLDRAGREIVLSVVDDWRGKVRGGEVVIETERDLTGPGDLEALIRSAHALAGRLGHCTTKETKKRLVDHFHSEPNRKVRATILSALGLGFPSDPDTLAVSREALSDTANDWIPVHAAANLGPEGIPHLQAILKDPRKDEVVHARCVRLLGAALPAEEAEAFLLEHLVDPRSAVAFAAAESFGERVGTAKAVPLLTEMADHHASSDVRKAAQKALDAIAVKLEGVQPGGLALAPAGEDGQLSRAEGTQAPAVSSKERIPSS